MNREIKFRAWLKKRNKMIDVEEINFTYKEVRYIYKTPFTRPIEITIPFEDIELMQYTGLKDKNGVEIYEGDIVKRITTFKAKILESINCVEFEKGCVILKNPSLTNHLFLCEEYELEVIGNIYENSKLLEVA